MLIGPILQATGKTLKAIIVHLGPGDDQGKGLDVSASPDVWAAYAGETLADFSTTLTEKAFGAAALSLYQAAVPTTITETQPIRAVIYDDADKSLVATLDIVRPGAAAIGEHRCIAPPFIFRLGRRSDGTTVAVNAIRIRPTEIVACAFDIARIAPEVLVASVASLAITGSAATVALLNDTSVLGSQAKFEVDATSGLTATDYTVTCSITTEEGDVIKASGVVECRA